MHLTPFSTSSTPRRLPRTLPEAAKHSKNFQIQDMCFNSLIFEECIMPLIPFPSTPRPPPSPHPPRSSKTFQNLPNTRDLIQFSNVCKVHHAFDTFSTSSTPRPLPRTLPEAAKHSKIFQIQDMCFNSLIFEECVMPLIPFPSTPRPPPSPQPPRSSKTFQNLPNTRDLIQFFNI